MMSAARLGRSIVGRLKRLGARALGPRYLRRFEARAATARAERENAIHFRGGPCIAIVAEAGTRHFYLDFLAWLATHDPELRRRFCLCHLPASLPADTRILHAWVQDPVLERSAKLFAELETLEAAARALGVRVIQPARALSNTLRLAQYEKLKSVGVRTARVVPIHGDFGVGFAGLQIPIVVRRVHGHSVPMRLLATRELVDAWLSARRGGQSGEWVAAEYHDVRSADGLYRKYRYLMTGARGAPRHMIASREWEVRPQGRVFSERLRLEERAFLRAPVAQHAAFDAARRALGFDIAAFDYSMDSRGEMIVWEVNPFPDLRPAQARLGADLVAEMSGQTYRLLADFYRSEFHAAARAPA